jgi:hypothetical protein
VSPQPYRLRNATPAGSKERYPPNYKGRDHYIKENNLKKQIMKAEKQLRELYTSKWADFCAAIKPIIEDKTYEIKPTGPLLLWPAYGEYLEYEKADLRVVIFGQETNDWVGVFNPDTDPDEGIEELMDLYDRFFEDRWLKSSFWNGFWKFTRMLESKFPDKKISFVWNNIIKMGKAGEMGRPPAYIYDIEQKHFSVVKEELDILKPDVLLFLTGPNYDARIEDKLGKLTFEPFSSYNERTIAKVKLPYTDFAYRTYHPNYIYRQGRGTIEAYYQAILDDIKL